MTSFARLGDVCDMRSGGTPPRAVIEYYGGDIPWVTIADMTAADGVVCETAERITNEGLAAIGNRLFEAGTILLAMYGSVGKLAIAGCSLATNQAILGLRPRDPNMLDSRYLKRWLGSIQRKLVFDARGVTQANISKGLVEDLSIPLPDMSEQRRIADILDKADAIRRKRKEAIALTEQLLRSTFLEMFGDPVTNAKGWAIVELGDYAPEMTYGTSEKCDPSPAAGLPVLRIPNVVGGEINWDDLKYATLREREASALKLQKGDLLFVRTNGNPQSIARCAVYESDREALFASYLIRVRLDLQYFQPSFVRAALSTESYRSRLTAEARTTAGNYNISTEGLRRLRLPRPPLEMQFEFARRLSLIRTGRNDLMNGQSAAGVLFASLTEMAFPLQCNAGSSL